MALPVPELQVLASNHDWQLTLAPTAPHGLDTIVESSGEGANPAPPAEGGDGEGAQVEGGSVGAQGGAEGVPEAHHGACGTGQQQQHCGGVWESRRCG